MIRYNSKDWTKGPIVGVKSFVINGDFAVLTLSRCIKAKTVKVSRKSDLKSCFTARAFIWNLPSSRQTQDTNSTTLESVTFTVLRESICSSVILTNNCVLSNSPTALSEFGNEHKMVSII
jgi:hypothetical protein